MLTGVSHKSSNQTSLIGVYQLNMNIVNFDLTWLAKLGKIMSLNENIWNISTGKLISKWYDKEAPGKKIVISDLICKNCHRANRRLATLVQE